MAEDDRFYVKTLRLQNFRCFEDVELGPFDPSFNLLVGENGAGKSSVLVALANFFKPQLDLVVETEELITGNDIRATDADVVAHASILHTPPSIDVTGEFHQKGVDFSQAYSVGWQAIPTPNRSLGLIDLNGSNGVAAAVILYRTSRKFEERTTVESDDSSHGSRATAYVNWSSAGRDYTALREWLKNETLLALQSQKRQNQTKVALRGTRSLRYLTLLSTAIGRAFEGAQLLEFDAQVSDIVLELRSGERKKFSQMSDGQRVLIGLIADIVWRFAMLNGERLGAETLTETPGLVLIDEIDLHLHPKWQRQIVPALKEVFPKIQFFATTHAPQVIGECRTREIVLLRDGKQEHPPGSFGMDSNWILECVMGAPERNKGVAERIAALSDALDEGRLEEAKAEIAKLRTELPAVSPDIVGAETYLWNLEHDPDEAAE